MKKIIPLLFALAACGGWAKRDTLGELVFAGITIDDWRQTKTIVTYCEETNPVIGACGEKVSPDVYMPSSILAHAAISALLPGVWRTVWQAATIGGEASTVWTNYRSKWWEPPIVIYQKETP